MNYTVVSQNDLDVSSSKSVPSIVNAPSATVAVHSSLLPSFPPNYGAVQQEDRRQWKIDLCEVGDCCSCLYSYLCPICAIADARTTLDGSNWYVNCFLLKPCTARWLVRTAYNIPGNAQNDCWSGFLPCCIANQILQTTEHYGKTNIPDVGPSFNVNPRPHKDQRWLSLLYDYCYMCICGRCAMGYSLQAAGMPFWFGCCVGVLEANSILRYQHRYRPPCDNECCNDLIIPLLAFSINRKIGYATIFVYGVELLAEDNTRVSRTCGYGCDIGGALCYSYRY
eukprot:gene13103-14377_t